MTVEHTLWSQIRELRAEVRELRFEKWCLVALAAALGFGWLLHMAIVHARP